METPINPVIAPIVREFKASLQQLYGDRLHDVVLYGSYARGDYDDESDIDLLVILNDASINTYAEIFRITDVEADMTLKYGIPISPLPVAYSRYLNSPMPVYQEVRREGIRL